MTNDSKSILYEKNHFIIINDIKNLTLYYFDYGERSCDTHMKFSHTHPFYEIHILLHPQARHFIEGIPYSIRENDFVLLRPSILHKSEYPEGSACKRLVISFLYPPSLLDTEAYANLLEPFFAPVPIFRFPLEQRQILNDIINRIYRLSLAEPAGELHNLMVHTLFVDFLYHLRQLQADNIYQDEPQEDELSVKIFTVANYIHNHYQDEINLEFLAKEFYISPSYLSHQFKNITGYSLIHYIHLTRIHNIQYLLLNTDKKITEIAQRCGFTSFSQFNRIFQKFCEMSPSEYRKSNRTQLNQIGSSPD